MRVKFIADYDHVEALTTTAYKAGMELTVRADIGQAAVKAGKAHEMPLLKEQEEEASPPKARAAKRGDG